MKTLKIFWFILLLSLFFSTGIYSQNEANVWYFQDTCGLDFNSGSPVELEDGQLRRGVANATISDSIGNFLFCTDWSGIYTIHGIMQNSENTIPPCLSGLALVKWPGQQSLYYLFLARDPEPPNPGLYYWNVDLSQGLWGVVTEKNVPIDAGWDANGRIAIVKKSNSESVWVIVRKNIDDAYAAFLVDENGFHPDPVISPMPDGLPEPYWEGDWGYIKISYDKKYLVSNIDTTLEICSFNSDNGSFEYMYSMGMANWFYPGISGIEFSPDSKYLYVNWYMTNDSSSIYQYDMNLITDRMMFQNSAINIGGGNSFELQLARDGKIYSTPNQTLPDAYHSYISVIHNPWIRGTGCMYENNAINLLHKDITYSFPNILVDYLLRFEWTGEQCQGYPIHFTPNFIPTPDSIVWHFGELAPGSMTTELSPTYAFKYSGIHEVEVDIWYPTGRFEHTSREIEIYPTPQPDLGPDITICEGTSVTLNANCSADMYSWSTSQFGSPEITVSDSGTYWVRASFFDTGCTGSDTIHVGFYSPVLVDETSLVITPTSCGGATGSITGLTILGADPMQYLWEDLSGNDFGTDVDIFDLPAGQYILTITDGNGCVSESLIYTIEDAGNLQVTQVQTTTPHCFRNDGQIIISAFSPSGSVLEYSIDNGNNYSTDSIFTNLLAGSYIIHIKDVNGCEGFYIDNPVILADIPGPQVQPPVITDETDFLGNGSVEITASGSTLQIFYSINNGSTWQTNNGIFSNLSAGTFTCIVKDENDCDTTFIVEIQNLILTFLHAITGEGGHCLGNTAMVPVNVDNFNSVATFHLKLSYNADNLQCEGFTNVHPQLLDSLTGWVDQAAGVINLTWNSPSPVTFTQPETVAELVFTTKNPGQGELAWYTGTTESYFTNSSGNPIPSEFQTGEVKIYEPPEIVLDQSKTVCTGQFASIMSIAVGNQPPIDYRWIYPSGDTSSFDPIFFNITLADAGNYTLLATDRVGCTDQKSIELIVSENPVAAFHGTDTLEMHTGDVLDAGAGLSSYHWNTGDTTESIIINAEGMYSVEMESPVGCLGSDSVYVKLTTHEIPETHLFIPNAFTPDGDGVNDTFLALYNGNDISNFTMEVYDRWGGRIFRSENILVGWDGKKNGKDCPGGVYVYKIVFSVDGIPGNQERVGTVMLVR
jgi:gliding motility-associated-like protein